MAGVATSPNAFAFYAIESKVNPHTYWQSNLNGTIDRTVHLYRFNTEDEFPWWLTDKPLVNYANPETQENLISQANKILQNQKPQENVLLDALQFTC